MIKQLYLDLYINILDVNKQRHHSGPVPMAEPHRKDGQGSAIALCSAGSNFPFFNIPAEEECMCSSGWLM